VLLLGERVVSGEGGSLIWGECLRVVDLFRVQVATWSGHADAKDLGARVCGPQDRAVLAQAQLHAADGAEVPGAVRAVPVAAAKLRVGADDPADE
jgi:hypothetical protein